MSSSVQPAPGARVRNATTIALVVLLVAILVAAVVQLSSI